MPQFPLPSGRFVHYGLISSSALLGFPSSLAPEELHFPLFPYSNANGLAVKTEGSASEGRPASRAPAPALGRDVQRGMVLGCPAMQRQLHGHREFWKTHPPLNTGDAMCQHIPEYLGKKGARGSLLSLHSPAASLSSIAFTRKPNKKWGIMGILECGQPLGHLRTGTTQGQRAFDYKQSTQDQAVLGP